MVDGWRNQTLITINGEQSLKGSRFFSLSEEVLAITDIISKNDKRIGIITKTKTTDNDDHTNIKRNNYGTKTPTKEEILGSRSINVECKV